MRSRGQRRFPGIVITTFKRRRVNLVEWSPLCPLSIRPSFIRFMFYDECTPRLMFMGNAVWPLSAFNPFRSLFSPLFLFLLILSNPSKRISILDILYPSYFSPPLFFSAPPTFARNSRRNYRKWGEGSVVQRLLRLEEELKSWRENWKPLDTLLCEFD